MMRLCKKRTILISGLILVGGLLYGFWPLSERSDQVGYYAPCWGKGNRIFFIKNVTYGYAARYTPLNSWLTRAVFFGGSYTADKSEVYLCSMNWDGTDKKEIVKLGDTEDDTYWLPLYLDYCEANNSLLLSGEMHPARGTEYEGVYTIKADGSGKKKISDMGLHASWSPGGKRLVYRMHIVDEKVREDLTVEYCNTYNSLWVMNADGSENRQLFEKKEEIITDHIESPIWSPKGDLIAFVCNFWIWVMKPDGGERRKVGKGMYLSDWLPNGEQVILVHGGIYKLNGEKENIKSEIGGKISLDGKFTISTTEFIVWNIDLEKLTTGNEIDLFADIKRTQGHFVYKRPNNIW